MMKKAAAAVLVILLLFSCACADDPSVFKVMYNIRAVTFSAPQISDHQKINDLYVFTVTDTFCLMAQENAAGEWTALSVCCNSDDEFADFLFASVALLTTYESTNTALYGAIVFQISNIRAGRENTVFLTGNGGFTVKSTENWKYMFLYSTLK